MPLDAYVSSAPTFQNQQTQIKIEIPVGTDLQDLYGLSFTLQLDSEWAELIEGATGFGTMWGENAITIVRKTSPTSLDVGVSRVDGQPISTTGILFTLDITPVNLGTFGVSWTNVSAQDRDGNSINIDINPLSVDVVDPNQRNVIFQVDVREQISNGMFNPALNDTIFVLGTFGDWAEPIYDLEWVAGTLYRARVPIIGDQDQVIEYKYRIITGDGRTIPDAGWEQSVGPGLNGNRILVLGPVGTEQTLSPMYFSNVLPRADLMEPSSEQSDVSLNPVFKWNSVDYVESYEITVSTNPDLSNPIFLETLTDTVFQSSTPLEYNTIYYWAVSSSLNGIQSPLSTIHSFTTIQETIFRPFVTVWNTTLPGETGSNQILIPGVGEYEIYWESSENVSVNGRVSATGAHLLTLPQPGLYLIMITGGLEAIRWPEQELPTDAGKWISINQWGDVRWSSMAYFADQATNLRIFASDAPDLQDVRNMERAFRGAESMNDPIGHWDVSGVEIATELFSHAFNFNQPLSDWDVSGMTDFSAMFVEARSFDQNLGMWTISDALFMANMLDRSGMSTANYDATLIGWAGGSTVPRDITFGAEGLVYAASETARQTLIDDFNWTFIGDSNSNLSRIVTFQVDMSIQVQNAFFRPDLNDVVEVLGQFNNFETGTNEMALVSDHLYSTTIQIFGAPDLTQSYKFRVRPGDGRELLEAGWELTVGPGGDGQRVMTLGEVDVDQILPVRYFNNELPVPALLDPADNATNMALTPQFQWTNVPHVDSYTFLLATESTFSTPLIEQVVVGTEFSPSNPLTVATEYFWTVRANQDDHKSNWAQSYRFTTEDNPEHPVAHVPFDGVVQDISGSQLSFSLNSPLFTIDRFGNSGSAWLHQSNQDLKILHNEALPTNHLTISFWFNRESNPTDDFENLLYKDGSFQTYMSDQQRLFTGFPTATPGEWTFYATPYLNLNLNRWYHYTFTFDRTTGAMTHYIDGKQVWQDIETNTDHYLKASEADLSIGRSGVANDHHARGAFDELRLYDRSLSAGEVLALYSAESGTRVIPIQTPDLISPVNNATGVSQDPTFRWSSVADAESYVFQLSTDSGFNSFIIDMSMSDTLFSLSGIELAKNTLHHWRVKAIGAQGESGFSPSRQFTTVSDVFRPFVTTWKSDNLGLSGNNQLVIPGVGSGYQIQWVEVGNVGNFGSSTGNGTHIVSFPTPGTYRVSISGPLESFGWIPSPNEDDAPKLLSIDQWGDIEWVQLNWVMAGTVGAQILATDTPNLSDASSIRGAFQNAINLNDPITDWDVSNVVDMSQMFENALRFNQPLFTWDVGSVQIMDRMFFNATDFNQSVGNWDVGNVTTMSQLFAGASSFNRPLGNWDVSKVTNMSNMFRDATAFDQYIGNWDIRNVTNMEGIFDQSGLSTLNYDNTLIAWAANPNTPQGITIGVAGLIYDFPGEAARQTLITDFGWTFVGDSPSTIRPPSIAEPITEQRDVPLQATIRLNSVAGATAYDIQVSTSNDFQTLELDLTIPASELTTVFSAQSYTGYFLRARSRLDVIIGDWSDVVFFETELTPPTIQFPSLGQMDISTAPVLTWIPSSLRTQSEVSVSLQSGFGELIEHQTVATPSLSLIDLASGTTYFWRVRSIDPSNGKLTPYVTGSFTTRPFVATVPVVTTITFPQSRTVSGYRMFGIPGTDSFPVKSVLSGIPQIEYRLFDDNGADVDYLVEFTNADNWSFATGRGYWILSTKAIEISSSITNVTPDNADLFPVDLHAGWNIITNPLTDPVRWVDVQTINSIDWDLFGFDGSFAIADTLRSFSGYYVNNSTGSARQILIPFTPGDRRKAVDRTLAKQVLESNDFAELSIGYPTDEGIRTNKVRVEVGDEPSIRIHPSLDFSAYGVVMKNLESDDSRDVFHHQTITEPIVQFVRHLRIENLANLPLDIRCDQNNESVHVRCAILDPNSGRTIDLDSKSQTSITLPSGDYIWAVGSSDFLETESDKLIPNTFQLANAYPNPFNPSTSIRFSIPDQGKTEVVVYDILGRQVATLLNSTLNRGWHLVSFDASKLSSGVYIIHVRSGAHQGVQKVTLMK